MLPLANLNKLITSLVNYILSYSEGEESTTLEVSLALQCVHAYWMTVSDYLDQKSAYLLNLLPFRFRNRFV